MPEFDSPLENVKIASPCSADWNEMYGDERKRFCGDCKLNVYNLSGMTKTEAESLILNAEGRLCVRFYQRADGSVITTDCPVGLAGVKHRTRVFATAAASLLMAILTGVFFVSIFSKATRVVVGEMIPYSTPTPEPRPLMGAIAINPDTNSNKPKEDPYVMGKIAVPPTKKKKTMTEVKGEVVIREVERTM
ncbi:MAG TPA: hypothetical protein PLP21_03090 [Pyrinomonadaceae bacterium]|nr:hypothetical protein [Acidobacteriota bacterium]HQZ95273.1 hypothetical protein [Pyrinomonadaceae bacterium]